MFCRHCGSAILPDSQFCSKCGRRLAPGVHRFDGLIRTLRLKTPYPYAILVFLGFLLWTMAPDGPEFDYTTVRFEFELAGESSAPEQDLYRHHFSLIVENVGGGPVPEVPVELVARLEPSGVGEVEADFLGRRLVLLRGPLDFPLIVVLGDPLDVAEKRRYNIDGWVTAPPPFEIAYEIREPGTGNVLTRFAASIPPSDSEPSPSPASALDQARLEGGQ